MSGRRARWESRSGTEATLGGETAARRADAGRGREHGPATENERLQRRNECLRRENDRLKRKIDHLEKQLATARRAGFRQAAPFAKDRPQGDGGRPGRRAGAAYGRQACRPRPAQVDEHYAASAPVACPDCGGAVEVTRVASQYQEELPVVRPVVRRFDVEVGHCSQCQRRVEGRNLANGAMTRNNYYLNARAYETFTNSGVRCGVAQFTTDCLVWVGLTFTTG